MAMPKPHDYNKHATLMPIIGFIVYGNDNIACQWSYLDWSLHLRHSLLSIALTNMCR